MGEYEPDDSRKVTQADQRAPGEPPRTGPREEEARRKARRAEEKEGPISGKPLPDQQQRARQSQTQGGQSQSQSSAQGKRQATRTEKPGNPDAQEMQAEPDGPLAGNQPQATDNPIGTAEPVYDQYELNHPQNMHRQAADHQRKAREQAGLQADAVRGLNDGTGEVGDLVEDREKDKEEAQTPPKQQARGYGDREKAQEDIAGKG